MHRHGGKHPSSKVASGVSWYSDPVVVPTTWARASAEGRTRKAVRATRVKPRIFMRYLPQIRFGRWIHPATAGGGEATSNAGARSGLSAGRRYYPRQALG